MVHEGEQLVVEQVRVERPAGLLIEQQLFRQGVAQAHGHSAVYLRLSELGVHQLAAVVYVHKTQDLDLAELHIHLHLGIRTAEGVGVGLYLCRGLGSDVPAVLHRVEGLRCKLSKVHERLAVRLAYYSALNQVQIRDRHPRELVRVVEDTLA